MYSRISALGLGGHFTSCFKRVIVFHVDGMWTSTKGIGGQSHVVACGQGKGSKT